MRKASSRAATRGGVPNALFVWAPVEQLPPALTGVTDLQMIMPWGSLLRAVTRPDPAVLARLAGACRPGARFRVLLNLHPWRPPVADVAGIPEPDPATAKARLAAAYQAAGWRLDHAGYLTAAEIDALPSSWSRRLRSSRRDRFDVLALSGQVTPHPLSQVRGS